MRIGAGVERAAENILAPGYSKGKVEACLQERFDRGDPLAGDICQLDDIAGRGVRWLSQAGLTGSEQPPMGCF